MYLRTIRRFSLILCAPNLSFWTETLFSKLSSFPRTCRVRRSTNRVREKRKINRDRGVEYQQTNKSMKPRIDVRLGLCDWLSNQHVDVSNSQTTLSHYKRWSFKSSALEDAHLSSNIRCGHGSWRESVAEIEPTSSFRSQKQRYENVIECVDCKIFWHWVLTQSH